MNDDVRLELLNGARHPGDIAHITQFGIDRQVGELFSKRKVGFIEIVLRRIKQGQRLRVHARALARKLGPDRAAAARHEDPHAFNHVGDRFDVELAFTPAQQIRRANRQHGRRCLVGGSAKRHDFCLAARGHFQNLCHVVPLARDAGHRHQRRLLIAKCQQIEHLAQIFQTSEHRDAANLPAELGALRLQQAKNADLCALLILAHERVDTCSLFGLSNE